MDTHQGWPALEKDDVGLKQELEQLLTSRVVGDPYSNDGSFAANIAGLPPGLRAMAATHWLDISLTLDSLTWHFGNFGEPGWRKRRPDYVNWVCTNSHNASFKRRT